MGKSSVQTYYETLEPNKFETYEGIVALCEPGLHADVQSEVQTYVEPGSKVLDVGCGRGALSLRLHDAGYQVDGCDLFDLCECKDKIHFIHASAEEASFTGPYDAVMMIELLQATESPFGVVRRYAELVKPGGYVFISSPNVLSEKSRVEFFLRGRHLYFEEFNVTNDGSITPVHPWQLKHVLEAEGFTVVKQTSLLEEDEPPKKSATWAAIQMLRGYQRVARLEPDRGKIALTVARRKG